MTTTLNMISKDPYNFTRIRVGSFNQAVSTCISGNVTANTLHSIGRKALEMKYMQATAMCIAGCIVKIPMGGVHSDRCHWTIKFVRYDDEPGYFWGKRKHVDVNGENPFWGCETLHKISDIVD